MDFEKLCMMFTMQEPYYGILLSSMQRKELPGMGTMGVGRSGNVFVLYFDRKWAEALPIDTALEALRHEVLHIAFAHFNLWEEQHPSPEIQKIRNIAADLEVNSYVKKDKLDPKYKDEWLFADKFSWEEKEGTREYYSRLFKLAEQKQQQQQAQNPQQPCNGGLGSQQNNQQQSQSQQQDSSTDDSQQQQNQSQHSSQSQQLDSGSQQQGGQQPPTEENEDELDQQAPQLSKEFIDSLPEQDDHSMWPHFDSNADKEQMQQAIDDMLEFAADEVEKSRGYIPGEMQGRIKAIRERKKPKPVADWKRYFRRYLGNEFSEFIRKSKKRESRRFPDAAGNKHRRKSHILVAIDTSGSVSMPEYLEFFGQIKTLTASADFHVVECDATIQHEYDYRGKPNEFLHGGGGTSFQPAIDLFNKDRRKYDALVYFTDGYCNIPNDTPKDTIWVISSNGDQNDRNKYKVNGASVAFIPKQQ